MAGFISRLFGLEEKADYKTLLENGAILLDVRTEEEYQQGAVVNSLNIPLDRLNTNLSKLEKDRPIIAVCVSGMRSRGAVALLRSNGFLEVYNGGSWSNFK
ncbi:rhodanese-like domain-containing protein [Parabacteroides sp. PF5-9]|uniref:rhodanese-like domain-containing protein n=1 Tax=Parabacteroides sp. PF5-9 TaxID=1742404 RepID=UPI00247695F0|nr:rhodanese-like domain-containing protein [Parabacteroides sp. PF5-9]MDH6357002.1 phage shock protein E [Parabacteroides sp. PF5-9]